MSDRQFETAFRAALDDHPGQGEYERARTELSFGRRLRRGRRRAVARTHLRRAVTRFEALGGGVLTKQAGAEQRATGEIIRLAGAGSFSSLTPQELRVAVAVASGASN